MFFWPLTTQFYGKIVPKIQHWTRASTFGLQIKTPNGTFSQPESTQGACRDCDARNYFDARTKSDARCSNDARTEFLGYMCTYIIFFGEIYTSALNLSHTVAQKTLLGGIIIQQTYKCCVVNFRLGTHACFIFSSSYIEPESVNDLSFNIGGKFHKKILCPVKTNLFLFFPIFCKMRQKICRIVSFFSFFFTQYVSFSSFFNSNLSLQ